MDRKFQLQSNPQEQQQQQQQLTHVDSLLDRNGRTSQGDNDGGGSGGRLQQDSGKDTNHQTGNGIGFIPKQFSSLAPTHDLGSTSEKLQPKQEKVEEEDNGADTNRNPAPLFLCVNAACSADFGPSRLTILFLVLDLKVGVTKVDRVGGTFLARTGQVLVGMFSILVDGHVLHHGFFACGVGAEFFRLRIVERRKQKDGQKIQRSE